MTRSSAQVVADIRAFRPSDDDWRPLDPLLDELWATGETGQYIPDLLAVLERFPVDDGAGVLWSIVHGLESLPGYEPDLVRSVQRRPSELAVTMVGRLLNSGTSQVDGTSLVALLRSVGSMSAVSGEVRALAAKWAAKHA